MNDHKNEQIQKLIDQNAVNDLKTSFAKRDCLNTTNLILNYVLNAATITGLFFATFGTSFDNKTFQWIGLGFIFFASLLDSYQKNHVSMLKTLLLDITNIQKGSYIDSENILTGIENPNQAYVKVYTQDTIEDIENPDKTNRPNGSKKKNRETTKVHNEAGYLKIIQSVKPRIVELPRFVNDEEQNEQKNSLLNNL